MHFDPREQAALREVGLTTDELQTASERVAEAVTEAAADLEAFFAAHDTVYSDMDLAHSADQYPEHAVEWLDTYTHAADLRGWLRFEGWGVPVEDGRVLARGDGEDGDGREAGDLESADAVVELSLGPTVHDRVRFAPTREALE